MCFCAAVIVHESQLNRQTVAAALSKTLHLLSNRTRVSAEPPNGSSSTVKDAPPVERKVQNIKRSSAKLPLRRPEKRFPCCSQRSTAKRHRLQPQRCPPIGNRAWKIHSAQSRVHFVFDAGRQFTLLYRTETHSGLAQKWLLDLIKLSFLGLGL